MNKACVRKISVTNDAVSGSDMFSSTRKNCLTVDRVIGLMCYAMKQNIIIEDYVTIVFTLFFDISLKMI